METTMFMINPDPNMTMAGNSSVPPRGQEERTDVFYILITIVVGIGMIGIGATVHYKVLLHYLKNPKAYLVGVLMQLLIMPPLAWAFTRIFVMPFGEALGVFIQGCSPGGSTSNLVVYWMGGIVDLSVAMTITTTLVAMGSIPVWLLIYEAGEANNQSFSVPYDRLAIALAVLVIPIFIGMVIRVKLEKYAAIISKVTVTLASIGVLVLLIVRAVVSPIPWLVSWRQAVVAALLPLVAFGLGYLVTLIPWFKFNSRVRTTVAVETSMQNAQIASAVIELTAGNRILLFIQMVLFPLLYYVFQLGYAILFIAFYNLAKRRGWITVDDKDAESDILSSRKSELKDIDSKEKQAVEMSANGGKENAAYEDIKD